MKLAQFLWQFLVQGNLHNYLDILHWLQKISNGQRSSSGAAFIKKNLIGFKLASQSTLRQKQSLPQCFRLELFFSFTCFFNQNLRDAGMVPAYFFW